MLFNLLVLFISVASIGSKVHADNHDLASNISDEVVYIDDLSNKEAFRKQDQVIIGFNQVFENSSNYFNESDPHSAQWLRDFTMSSVPSPNFSIKYGYWTEFDSGGTTYRTWSSFRVINHYSYVDFNNVELKAQYNDPQYYTDYQTIRFEITSRDPMNNYTSYSCFGDIYFDQMDSLGNVVSSLTFGSFRAYGIANEFQWFLNVMPASGNMNKVIYVDNQIDPEYYFGKLFRSDTSYQSGYTAGYNKGLDSGYVNGYNVGYNEGINEMSAVNTSAATIFAGILEVGLLPVNVFLSILNFEVFGINVSGFVSGLLTVAVIIILLRFVFGGKGDDK